jgi:hypothetical protein
MAVTMPVPEPIVALAVLLLLHVPLPDASVRVKVPPGQTGELPVMSEGRLLTVTTTVAMQPEVIS